MAEHIPVARDRARREIEQEQARKAALAKAAREQAAREAELKRLAELADHRAKEMAQDTFRRLKGRSSPEVSLVVKFIWVPSFNFEGSYFERNVKVGQAWVLREPFTYYTGSGEDAWQHHVPGLWLDNSGILRAAYLEERRLSSKRDPIPNVSIDDAYPPAVWGRNYIDEVSWPTIPGEPVSCGQSGHCSSCGPGTPLIYSEPDYSASESDPHSALLARHLVMLLGRHNLL